jgi:hypothetical protein
MTDLDPVAPRAVGPVADALPRALAGAGGDATFRRLLESLEGMARAPAAPIADADDLQRALRRADEEFATAMELRQRLLAAVRGGT